MLLSKGSFHIGLAKDSVKIVKFQSMGRCPDGRNVSFGNQFFFRIGRLAGNVLQLPEGGDFEALHCQPSTNFDKSTKLDLTTEPPLLGRCC